MYFNPRSREGSDRLILRKRLLNADFNPRSREGSDSTAPIKAYHKPAFQSTLP